MSGFWKIAIDSLEFRNVLRMRGKYSRKQFWVFFYIPSILAWYLVTNIYSFETFLIRMTYRFGLFDINTLLISQYSSVLIIVIVGYVAIVTIIKRYRDLLWSRWLLLILLPIPITWAFYPFIISGFITILTVIPGKNVQVPNIKPSALEQTIMVLGSIVSFILLLGPSLLFAVAPVGIFNSLTQQPIAFRIWNQTIGQVKANIIVRTGNLYQGFPSYNMSSNQIIRDEDIIFHAGEYQIFANDENGNRVFSQNISSNQLDANGRFQRIIVR